MTTCVRIRKVRLCAVAGVAINCKRMGKLAKVLLGIAFVIITSCQFLSLFPNTLSLSLTHTHTHTHTDIDECFVAAVEGTDLCENETNSRCVNSEGSFDCVCVPGYTVVNGTCQRKLLVLTPLCLAGL